MKVTIHQPEHFPHESFFRKIEACDLFVVLDNVNFRKNYFQNRNLIKTKSGNDEWFGFPVFKKSTSLKIREVKVFNEQAGWKKKLFKKLKLNLGVDVEPYYDYDSLLEINMAAIQKIMKIMNIDTQIIFASDVCNHGNKSDLIYNICKEVNADSYLSGQSGKNYLSIESFKDSNIDVEFFRYQQKNKYSMLYNLAEYF